MKLFWWRHLLYPTRPTWFKNLFKIEFLNLNYVVECDNQLIDHFEIADFLSFKSKREIGLDGMHWSFCNRHSDRNYKQFNQTCVVVKFSKKTNRNIPNSNKRKYTELEWRHDTRSRTSGVSANIGTYISVKYWKSTAVPASAVTSSALFWAR